MRKSTSASGRPGVLFTILAASTQRGVLGVLARGVLEALTRAFDFRTGGRRGVKFKVLQADHSISCESPAYEKWKGYAWIMVLIYPVGIPCWYLLELLWWRKAINPDVDERRHNLTSKYQPV